MCCQNNCGMDNYGHTRPHFFPKNLYHVAHYNIYRSYEYVVGTGQKRDYVYFKIMFFYTSRLLKSILSKLYKTTYYFVCNNELCDLT